jgi:hypothetical protein
MSHTTFFVTPKIKCVTQEPPAFIELYALWCNDPANKDLRFGQWFYNRFLGSVQGDKRDFVDRLHAERDIRKCQDMIETLYKEYQWPMA